MTHINALRGRRNRKRGAAGEALAIMALRSLGIRCVHLETGWRIHRGGGRIVSASPMRSVLADIVGVRNGRAYLVEVKVEDGPTLSLSRIEPHQRENLTSWRQSGAEVLIAWVRLETAAMRRGPVALIPWPCGDLEHGRPLTEAAALRVHGEFIMRMGGLD